MQPAMQLMPPVYCRPQHHFVLGLHHLTDISKHLRLASYVWLARDINAQLSGYGFNHGRLYNRCYYTDVHGSTRASAVARQVIVALNGLMLLVDEAAARDSESALMHRCCPSVRLSVRLSICPFVSRQNVYQRRDFLKN